jgi:hypothetical protein
VRCSGPERPLSSLAPITPRTATQAAARAQRKPQHGLERALTTGRTPRARRRARQARRGVVGLPARGF